jgi:hypothetical protein
MRSAPTAVVLHDLREAVYAALPLLDRIARESESGVIRELARDAAGPLRNTVAVDTTDEWQAAFACS